MPRRRRPARWPETVGGGGETGPVTAVQGHSTTSTDSAIPTQCRRCTQPLLLLSLGRNICERCRLGRSVLPESMHTEGHPASKAERPPAVATPCLGCGCVTQDNGARMPMADGYCLSCGLDGLRPERSQ
jgi:hypothetical protein